jgi:hypothetical protein
MAAIDLTSGSASAYGAGELQLQNKVQMTGTLTPVTDNLNVASPLLLSTTLVQSLSTFKITTADNPYIDAEDNSGNNRFTVGRATSSQQVNVDFASNPTGSTTAVGAIRTYRDGVNLSEAMTFIEDGSIGVGTTAPVGLLDLFKSAAATRLAIRGDAGQNRLISYRTGAVQRFGLYVNNTAESGANAGSDFAVRAYSDAGTLLSTPLFIQRSTGNLGMGTTTPTGFSDRILNIFGATSAEVHLTTNGSGTLNSDGFSLGIRDSDGSVQISQRDNSFMAFATNDTERMRITSTGNVGIGTTAPVGKLQINAPSGVVSPGSIALSIRDATSPTFGFDFNLEGSVSGDLSLMRTESGVQSQIMTFVRANGNVGIGTSSPSAMLTLNRVDPFIRIERTGVPTWQIQNNTLVSSPGFSINNVTNATAPFFIDGITDNVGIGTAAPDNVLDLGSPSQGRGLTFDNYSNVFSTFSAGDLVLSNNFYGSTSTDTYLTSATATFGAAGIRVSGTSGTGLGGQIQFFANTATAKTAGTAFTPTEICRVTPNGLTFNGDTAAANALDDYEEGTWTIGVTFGGASVGVVYANNTGTYTKIGRQVTINGLIELSNKGSSSGAARITGLPFTIANTFSNYSAPTLRLSNIAFLNQFEGYGEVGDTTIRLQESTSLGVVTDLTEVEFANNSGIILSFTYFV